jgi:Asp-tRNA(Asn)/Glu-tRNA(Gln) amidotransferase A subunit family amidase
MHELLSLTLVELTARLRARQASPVELMQAVLARIDETHDALNAVVVRRDPEVCLAEARAAEQRIARGAMRPLEGVHSASSRSGQLALLSPTNTSSPIALPTSTRCRSSV